MDSPPLTRIVLYKHGVGHFEREGDIEGSQTLTLTFKQSEVSDVLKSLTVLDLDGGHIASVSYDSTKPLAQLLAEVALFIPDENSLISLLPQIKGSRVAVHTQTGQVEGLLLGVDVEETKSEGGIVRAARVSLLNDGGGIESFNLFALARLEILDAGLRRDLDYYLRTQLSAKKKDARGFTFFAEGEGKRRVRLSYTVEAPVWKATYRVILGEEGKPPMIQGWAVVDNTTDEDWDAVSLSLVAGLPVSFQHDLYTPRYIRRPVVEVKETTGVLPPTVEEGIAFASAEPMAVADVSEMTAGGVVTRAGRTFEGARRMKGEALVSSMPAQVRERKLGDLFAYDIEHPVTIRRNQSALVPIVLRAFEGKPVLLYNKQTRAENPMRCVEFKNTTGLTLEGGPVTVLEGGSYVGEAMLDTLKPDEPRLVPFAVELGVTVLDNIDSHQDRVHQVVIRKGVMKTGYGEVRQTTYTLHNKGDEAHTLYLEHSREGGDWKLHDTSEPVEITEHYWRFRLHLEPRQVTKFVVRQRRLLAQTRALGGISPEEVSLWLQQRYLDARTAELLRKAIALREQGSECEVRVNQLRAENESIHREQERIRGNLASLGDRSAEKDLRDRFVRALNSQEDRLEAIRREVDEQNSKVNQYREEMNAVLQQIELETTL